MNIHSFKFKISVILMFVYVAAFGSSDTTFVVLCRKKYNNTGKRRYCAQHGGTDPEHGKCPEIGRGHAAGYEK